MSNQTILQRVSLLDIDQVFSLLGFQPIGEEREVLNTHLAELIETEEIDEIELILIESEN